MNAKDFQKRKEDINKRLDDSIIRLETGSQEAHRVGNIAKNTRQILDELDEQFCRKTGLTKPDLVFLFLATGLQIARQYLLSNEKCRFTAAQGDHMIDSALSLAPPDWRNVLTQSVPYDATKTGIHISGTGLSGATHRYRTLGHDPIFGWIFGPANIMTNSLTKSDFTTYQVKNMTIIRHYPNGVGGMLEHAVSYSINDPKLLAVSVAKQAVHFGSDYFTKQGLAVPFVSTLDNNLAQQMLSKWHIDMWGITRGAALAEFINQLIAMIHHLFCEGTTDRERKLYEVRTRKILSYSNLIASSSNAAIVAITHDMTKFDVGGISVTIWRLIHNRKFIRQVKEDFIFGTYREMI